MRRWWRRIVATTDDAATTADTVLYLRRACLVTTTELACNNDINATNTDSTITVSVEPGTYFLIVDARGPASSGGYVLRVTRHAALGEGCALETDCAPDHICRTPAGSTTMSCELPVCGDSRDDDADGDIDFPNDPGCTSTVDSSETDTCPGAGCPACGNGVDDDGDGQTDYPADTSCASASSASELNCTTGDPVRMFTGNVTGQTTGTPYNEPPSPMDDDLDFRTDLQSLDMYVVAGHQRRSVLRSVPRRPRRNAGLLEARAEDEHHGHHHRAAAAVQGDGDGDRRRHHGARPAHRLLPRAASRRHPRVTRGKPGA